MSLKDILDADWQINVEKDIEFKFRATVQDLHNNVDQFLVLLNELKNATTFQNVHQDIKDEALTIINATDQYKAFLDAHSEFTQWRKP